MQRVVFLALAVSLVGAVALAADTPPVVKVLLESGDVSGWSAIDGTYAYCPDAASLTDIYDGQADWYSQQGVTAAATQAYQKDDDQMLMIANQMTSWQTAKALFKYWKQACDDAGGVYAVKVKEDAFYYVAADQTMGFMWRRNFFCSFVTYGDEDRHIAAVKAFIRATSKEIGSL